MTTEKASLDSCWDSALLTMWASIRHDITDVPLITLCSIYSEFIQTDLGWPFVLICSSAPPSSTYSLASVVYLLVRPMASLFVIHGLIRWELVSSPAWRNHSFLTDMLAGIICWHQVTLKTNYFCKTLSFCILLNLSNTLVASRANVQRREIGSHTAHSPALPSSQREKWLSVFPRNYNIWWRSYFQ